MKYVADDGTYFDTEEECMEYIDKLIDEHTKQIESLKAVKVGILQQQANQDSGYDAV